MKQIIFILFTFIFIGCKKENIINDVNPLIGEWNVDSIVYSKTYPVEINPFQIQFTSESFFINTIDSVYVGTWCLNDDTLYLNSNTFIFTNYMWNDDYIDRLGMPMNRKWYVTKIN